MFWANVTSNKVFVKYEETDRVNANIVSDEKRTSFYNYIKDYENEIEDYNENLTDFVQLFEDKSGLVTSNKSQQQINDNIIEDLPLTDMKLQVPDNFCSKNHILCQIELCFFQQLTQIGDVNDSVIYDGGAAHGNHDFQSSHATPTGKSEKSVFSDL